MKRATLLILTIITILIINVKSGYSQLKSIIHDFEGIDIGKKPVQFWETGGLSTQVVNNPATKGPMLGSNVFKITSNGAGTFGKDAYHMVELNVTNDYLNFYFYNPLSNGVNAKFNVILEDDDDHDGKYTAGIDDQWIYPVDIAPGSDWQLITIPLKSFKITGSTKGIFDVGYTFNSKILGFWFQYSDMGANKTFYMDMWSLSEGPLATGNTIFDLPNAAPTDQCMLGTFNSANNIWYPTNISDEAESSLNSPISLNDPGVQKKLCMVHWFIHFSDNQLSPNNFPGNEVQEIINNGYTPMITWEPMYVLNGNLAGAPSLADINNGQMDAYINQFADKIKTYTGTVMIRLMHEPNGNWYPWSIANNNSDTLAYKNAYRRFVNLFTVKGVTNVKWVWCVFYNTYPETQANWFANCYPGDKYVDIVGTDIYNDPAHDRVPEWISFRKAGIESYYTLTKLFPSKPLYICETACRERYYNYYDPASHTNWNEDVNSQTKGEWLKSQSQDLQTDFSKVRAAVFFDIKKEHDWKVYSKPSAPKDTMETINAFESAFWKNPYFTCNSTQPIAATSTPYNNSINNIPGTVEAENFDEGKIGVGYLDFPSTEANPHNYRISDVNIGTHYGGYHIGYIQKGEYLTYSVNVSESAMYDIDVNAASTQNTGSLRFILNRAKLTGSIRLPSTSSWDVFSPTTIHNVYMPAGKYILKIDFDGEGFNLDNMVFKKSLTAGLIASKQQDEIQVFPNPTLDKVAVLNSFNQEIIEVKLYDAVGQLVTKMTHPGNDFSLSLENLNQGFYNMEITTNIGKLQKRIIKL